MAEAKKILVVDDEEDIVLFLSFLLEDEGYEVITASDGLEGFNSAKQDIPDLITLDLSMPKHAGVKMYHDLKNDPDTVDIPIVIVTGIPGVLRTVLDDHPDIPKPNAYFEKPIDREEFLEKIGEMLL